MQANYSIGPAHPILHGGLMNNLWKDTGTVAPTTQELAGTIVVDVAIIGAGFTGLSAALHLAERGTRVAVVEANTIGHGGSGRNVGLVNAGLWTPPDEVEAVLGARAGQRLNATLGAAPDFVFDLIERHAIDCNATRNGTLHCASNTAGFRDLENRFRQQVERGAPVELLEAGETQARLGTAHYSSALLDRRAGTIQPLSYARGLAQAAIAAGTTLFEHTTASGWRYEGSRWHIETKGGAIRANRLIEATNAYPAAVKHARFTPVYFFQCATPSLPNHSEILPNGEGCWDTGTVMTSFRRDSQDRLVMGAVGKLSGIGARLHRTWALRKMAKLFPALRNTGFEHHWHGRIAMTRDHLPKIVETGPGAIAIFGYSGRGIGPGTVFGKAAADWALGDNDAFPIPIIQSYNEPLAGVRAGYIECGARMVHLINARI